MRFLGEVSEWLKEQPWKGCVGFIPTKGSNPFLSVFFSAACLYYHYMRRCFVVFRSGT